MLVKSITVGKGRITYVVQLPEGARMTSPQLMERVLQQVPTLPHHTCINGVGPTFGAVMDRTSRAHLLEHLVIDGQVRHYQGQGLASPLFVGNTRWVDEAEGIAKIQVSFKDDLVVMRAFREGIAYLTSLETMGEQERL